MQPRWCMPLTLAPFCALLQLLHAPPCDACLMPCRSACPMSQRCLPPMASAWRSPADRPHHGRQRSALIRLIEPQASSPAARGGRFIWVSRLPQGTKIQHVRFVRPRWPMPLPAPGCAAGAAQLPLPSARILRSRLLQVPSARLLQLNPGVVAHSIPRPAGL